MVLENTLLLIKNTTNMLTLFIFKHSQQIGKITLIIEKSFNSDTYI